MPSKYQFLTGESGVIYISDTEKWHLTILKNHPYESTKYVENASLILIKYFEVTLANSSVEILCETMGHQYLTTNSTMRNGKANYYILPLYKSSPVHLLIISQSVSCW